MDEDGQVGGVIGWFATNHVAANLLMALIVLGGIGAIYAVKKESIPAFQFDQIDVRVYYPGAGPSEVEKGIVIKIEEAIDSIEGVREVAGTAFEGMGQVSIEVRQGFTVSDILDEIKLAVDGISTFPPEAERAIIAKRTFSRPALNLQVHGDLDEMAMTRLAEQIRDEIVALPEVTLTELWGARPYEISIEVSEHTLREYDLTLNDVVQAIRLRSVDLPGGSIRSVAGDIRLRAVGQAYSREDFANITILVRPDGTRLRLGDLAEIRDGFSEVASYALFDGQRSLGISVLSTDNENEMDISAAVNTYVEARNATLPAGVELTVWADTTYYLKGRMNMMLSNLAMGAVLVMLILGLFLNVRIAAWVIVGLPVAFLGAFMLLPLMDVTINVMSLFAFILVLGIVVDDAIIVAESAFTETEEKGYSVANIVSGARRVAVPATFGVLTTVMAFVPLLFVTGPTSAINGAIAWVVILCLLFSMVESKLILPSHLALMKASHGKRRGVSDRVETVLKAFIARAYRPFLARAIEFRYATVAFFVGLMILTVGLFSGGFVRFVFFPEMDSDFLSARVEMREGSPEHLVRAVVDDLNRTLVDIDRQLTEQSGAPVVQHSFAYIRDGNLGQVQVELEKSERREISPKEVELRWREHMGEVAGAKELRFESSRSMGGGPPIALKLQGRDFTTLQAAADALIEHLSGFDGLYEVESSTAAGPEEIKLAIRPEAEALGVTLADVARQVREAFYGAEAQRVQRATEEVRVMVRYPRDERRSVSSLESMWIRLPSGDHVPFATVADYSIGPGSDIIRRIDGKRTVSVTASVDLTRVEPARVLAQVQSEFVPELASRFPGVDVGLDGSASEEADSIQQVGYAFMAALFGIYALMAVPLRSYLQPLIIMSVIPFGVIGAVIGHMLLGLAVNSVSIIGIIALSGVVVNDSIVMVDFVNRKVADGMSAAEASIAAGSERFRAILLTSLTTFFGLVPILAETSVQAQMVVPMAVSLAFGILFATVITLVLVPCLFNILGDLSRGPQRLEAIPQG